MTTYKEYRYVDLKQIIEAMLSYFPPDVLLDNVFYQALEAEFDWLADDLGFENTEAMLERLIRNDDANNLSENEE